jgi:dienelactone hydrolase
MLAELGYVAFAADIYGKGIRPSTPEEAGVDWQMVYYGGAVHAFTNPGAGSDPRLRAAYDARADARSWTAMRDFLQELFN